MNVEIGAEAALFPEKEYICKWDFVCSAGQDEVVLGPTPLSQPLVGVYYIPPLFSRGVSINTRSEGRTTFSV